MNRLIVSLYEKGMIDTWRDGISLSIKMKPAGFWAVNPMNPETPTTGQQWSV